jgi:integrase
MWFPLISQINPWGVEMVLIPWKISKRNVDALEARAKPYTKFDGIIAGFGAEVRPSGLIVFVLHYRPSPGGRGAPQRRLVLGHYGSMTCEQARSAALDAHAAIRQGHDPAGEKTRQRAALTISGLCDAFLSGHASKLKPKSVVAYEGGLAKVRAAHGALRAEALSRQHVAALHTAMASTPYAANRMVAAVSAMFVWCERAGLLPQDHPSPARGITRYREQGRERFLTMDELARLGDALVEGEAVGWPYEIDETKPTSKFVQKDRVAKIDVLAAAAIRLLILTGARLREILHARWSEFDLERGVLFLADSKTGRKPIYLGAAAQAVIAALPRLHGNPYLIPGSLDGRPRSELGAPWAAVTKAAGLEGLRIHDLRHSFASVGAGSGMGLPIVGKLLGHATQATTARYAHLDSDPMLRAAERIGATISGALNRSGGEVVKLRGK